MNDYETNGQRLLRKLSEEGGVLIAVHEDSIHPDILNRKIIKGDCTRLDNGYWVVRGPEK